MAVLKKVRQEECGFKSVWARHYLKRKENSVTENKQSVMLTITWEVGKKLVCTPLGYSSGNWKPLTQLGMDGWPHSRVLQSVLPICRSLSPSLWPLLLRVARLMSFICGTKTSQKQEDSPNAQGVFKLLFMSHLLMFQWPKQVT